MRNKEKLVRVFWLVEEDQKLRVEQNANKKGYDSASHYIREIIRKNCK